MLIPAFQLHLNNAILQGLATIGHYDGKHPCLTCATSAGKVFIHSPHERDTKTSSSIRFLNINKKITAMDSGRLNPEEARDVLMVGTQTNLLAYDVEENKDMFYKEVPDGVSALIFGHVMNVEAPLAIVGGNCSIQGFDAEGTELFWTVTGATVTALTFCDADGDGQNELLVGSDDYDIRIFQEGDAISEVTETDAIVGLCPIHLTKYGYALANGTVGVYNRTSRVWRVKSKNTPTCIAAFDLDSDGAPELISGWSNGRFEVRNDNDGSLIYRQSFTSPVSAIVEADYRLDGRSNIIACALDGEVRGYLPADGTEMTLGGAGQDESTMKELQLRKQEYLQKLRALEANIKNAKSGDSSVGIIPASTRISVNMEMNQAGQSVDMVISTNNDTIIKSVLVFALDGGLFEGESLMVYPPSSTNSVRVPLKSPKNVPVELKLQIIVGARGSSSQYHVFEVTHNLPKFSMFMHLPAGAGTRAPSSKVVFYVAERMNRVLMWLQKSFGLEGLRATETLEARFVCLRDGKPLFFKMTAENGGKITIRCDSMETAAELVQDLADFLGLRQLESVADFPHEMTQFREVLMKVDEYNAIRLKLTAEMADSSNVVKTLVIKAEDARILGDMTQMKRMYSELYSLNNELIAEYRTRSNNHQALLGALKEVNHMIQKAARLRVGSAKTRVVNACRAAIKANNIHSLFQIINQGRAAGSDA